MFHSSPCSNIKIMLTSWVRRRPSMKVCQRHLRVSFCSVCAQRLMKVIVVKSVCRSLPCVASWRGTMWRKRLHSSDWTSQGVVKEGPKIDVAEQQAVKCHNDQLCEDRWLCLSHWMNCVSFFLTRVSGLGQFEWTVSSSRHLILRIFRCCFTRRSVCYY